MIKLLLKYTKDGFWAAVLSPVFCLFEVAFGAYIPYVMANIIDVGINELGGDLSYITRMGLIMIGLSIGGIVAGSVKGWFSGIASSKFVRNLRMAMYEKIQTYDFKNIEKFPVPSVVMRLTTDLRMMRMAYVSIINMMARSVFNLIISAFMVYRLNNRLAIIFAFVVPILFTGLYTITIKAHPRFVQMMEVYDGLNANLEENIGGIRVVKTFVREDYEKDKFNKTSLRVVMAQRFAEAIVIFTQPFFELTMYVCMILVAWFGGKFIIAGTMTTGVFMSYLSYVKAILFSLIGISNSIMQVVMAGASIDRSNEIMDEVPDIDDSNADPDLFVEDGSVEFENVSFKYSEEGQRNVLSDIDLKIASGEVIGILGATGSSKSTLVQLIPRLYEATEGKVKVGGHDVREYKLHNLREGVSMVLQKNVLFSGSIEENVKWGNPNATHEEVVEACKNAQAHDFIEATPGGYDRELGQGGVNVSGGQKQRLCIARALLKKPKIIILDDSTSAVDTDTDHRIQLALKENLKDMTTIIIAQRVTSVKEADRIIIMDDGKIMDIGNHDELIARNEVYRDLYETQMEGAAE